jgi:hypothetical protein
MRKRYEGRHQVPAAVSGLLHELDIAAAACRSGFEEFARRLDSTDPERTPASVLGLAWDSYYFGAFARCDRLIRDAARDGVDGYGAYLPLSISHHNLHRLMQALRTEVGPGALADTRAPERVDDLIATVERMRRMFADVAAEFHRPRGER